MEPKLSLKPNDAKNIGARFRSARSLVPNLNRKSFCERHGINRYTMQSWENGLHISKGKNVDKFIEALAREGVYCTAEWLIDGQGESAKALTVKDIELPDFHRELVEDSSDKFILSLKALIDRHHDLVSCQLPDDAMAPKFLRGDLVFGKPAHGQKSRIHQKYCIIELKPEQNIVRKVIITKESLLLLALDDRTPSFSLSLDTKVSLVMGHLLNQDL